jgi:hypothetical protein
MPLVSGEPPNLSGLWRRLAIRQRRGAGTRGRLPEVAWPAWPSLSAASALTLSYVSCTRVTSPWAGRENLVEALWPARMMRWHLQLRPSALLRHRHIVDGVGKGSAVKRVSALLVRNFVRVVPAAIAVSGLLLAVAPHANAEFATGPGSPFHLKETNSFYRLGAPDLSFYAPVKETASGQYLFLTKVSTYHYEIHFLYAAKDCVAAADNGDTVDIKPCSGANGVVWVASAGQDGNSTVFESQHFSGKYLSGDGKGDQFHIRARYANGWYQQFRLI